MAAVNRADALKALDEAFAERLILEYDQLANGFMGGEGPDRERAKKTFAHGVDLHVEALAFAVEVINEKFNG